MTRLGLQIPNFSFPGVGPEGLFDVVVRQAQEAEASGFDTVMAMDHFYQLPMLGDPGDHMIEAYTLLAALARETERVRLGTLVTGNTYRNPGVLAKIITALDLVSNGRAQLGIGAGWFDVEHEAFGIEFGTFTDRFQKLEEALRIIIPMLRGEQVSLDGEHYKAVDLINSPAPLSRVPVMIGGSGERKTLRMVAQYADESNLSCDPTEVPRKLEALDEHCARLGRDRSEITVSLMRVACVAPTMVEAEDELAAALSTRGIDWGGLDAEGRKMFDDLINWGDPDKVGERLVRELTPGLDGFVISAPLNGHIPGRVDLLGRTAAAVVS